MDKMKSSTIIFFISLIVVFLIVGYVNNIMFVETEWVEGVTLWDKFQVYYLKTFFENITPASIIAGISTLIFNAVIKINNVNDSGEDK